MQPKRQATKSKTEVEDVKVDVKDISVKGVSVMIKGLSLEELSPEKDNTDVVEIKYKTPKIPKQTARRGIPLHGRKRNVYRKTLRELKKIENIEEPDDLGRSVKLKYDYDVDVSKSSYEEWLKDQNLVAASSAKEDVTHDSDVIIEIDTSNGEVCKQKDTLDETMASTLTAITVDTNSEVYKIDEAVCSDTVNDTLDESSHFEESSPFSYSEDDIAELYANLATSVITCFSAEFKMEACVKCLNRILDLIEQDKDEIIKRKQHKRSCQEKAEKENWKRFFGTKVAEHKKKEEEEEKVKVEVAECKKKEEEEEKFKAEVAEHKKKEEEEGKVKAEAAEHKKKEEEKVKAELAECKKKEEEEEKVKAEAAECKKKEMEEKVEGEVAEHKKKEEEEKKVEAEAAERKKKEKEEEKVEAEMAEHKMKEDDEEKVEAKEIEEE